MTWLDSRTHKVAGGKLRTVSRLSCLLGFAILSLGLIHEAFGEPDIQPDPGQQTISLDGNWKFRTFFGEGSNPLNVRVKSTDIVIDNSDSDRVTVNGNWAVKTEAERVSFNWGEDYLAHFFSDGDTDTNVRYNTTPPQSGYYEHFVYYPFGHHLTTRIHITHADGEFIKHVSQRNRCNQWISLGIYRLDNQGDSQIEVSAIDYGGVVADAVMLRPVDEAELKTAQANVGQAATAELDDSGWDELPVPGHWAMLNQYSNYVGKGWYRRSFTVPASWTADSQKKIRLKFDAVYHVANVYLNGKHVGRHQGGFTPFEIDVTEQIDFDGPNVLAVEADTNYMVGATWNWGGIIRSVSLVRNNDLRVSYQYVHADPDLEAGDAAVQVKVRVENTSDRQRQLTVATDLADDDSSLATAAESITVPANETTEIELKTKLAADHVRLWHFDTPHLYRATTTVSENEMVLHSRSDRFGIRKIELQPDGLLLNGEKVRLAGYNRVSDHRYWGSSEPQHVLEHDVELMKNANANFMRIMHGTQNERLIELCDEKGIMIFEEVNVRELTNPEFTAPDYPRVRQWLREMIERDVNHASVIGWSVGNELREHFDYAKNMIQYVKTELDPHRLVTCVSNTGYSEQESPENDPLGESDIMMQNVYMPTPEMVINALRSKWPNKPLFFSEFGLGRFDEESLDGMLPGLPEWNSFLRGQNTFVVGASLWTYNDYRSGYSQTLWNENRTWGLVNVWREKRRLYPQCQAENSPVKGIMIDDLDLDQRNASVTIPIKARDDYPSFTMRDYKLLWEFRDSDGDTIQSQVIELPTLTPDDEPWTGKFNWNELPSQPFDVVTQLKTPNGYVRAEKVIQFQSPPQPNDIATISGDGAIRVLFDRPATADDCYVKYSGPDGSVQTSKKTIDPYVDLTELENGTEYKIQVIASNSHDESSASEPITATPEATLLPPVLWHAFIADGKLVVGYSSEYEDEDYFVQYGPNTENLNKELASNVRGMMVIDVGEKESVALRIKRTADGNQSGWSNVITATQTVFPGQKTQK